MDQRRSVSLWRTVEGWTQLKRRRRESWNGSSTDSDLLRLQPRPKKKKEDGRELLVAILSDLIFFPLILCPVGDKRRNRLRNLYPPKSFEPSRDLEEQTVSRFPRVQSAK